MWAGDVALRFYAMMYGVPVVMANRVGHEQGADFWGGSRIVGPRGETLVQCEGDSPCLLSADLHYDAVRHARFELPTLRDSDLDLIQREYGRLDGGIHKPR